MLVNQVEQHRVVNKSRTRSPIVQLFVTSFSVRHLCGSVTYFRSRSDWKLDTPFFFLEDHCNILQEVLDKKAELEV